MAKKIKKNKKPRMNIRLFLSLGIGIFLVGALILTLLNAQNQQDVRSDASTTMNITEFSEAFLGKASAVTQFYAGNFFTAAVNSATPFECTDYWHKGKLCSGNTIWENTYIMDSNKSFSCEQQANGALSVKRECNPVNASSCQAPGACVIGGVVCCGGSTPVNSKICGSGEACPSAYSKKNQFLVRNGKLWNRRYSFGSAWTSWSDVTSSVSSVGGGEITSFIATYRAVANRSGGYTEQYMTRGGRVWNRSNKSGWSSWVDVTSNFTSVGTGTITAFSATVHPQGYINQFLTRQGKVWTRNNKSGWSAWTDASPSFSSVGGGTIMAFSTTRNTRGYIDQHLVRGGQIYHRDYGAKWSNWTNVSSHVAAVGTGVIGSLMTDSHK